MTMETGYVWKMIGTKEKIEKELNWFVFKGPGFYLDNQETVLIFPLYSSPKETWYQSQPKETLFHVEVWDCPFSDTIYSVIATAPVRKDDRY
jgi:hypothetical protein